MDFINDAATHSAGVLAAAGKEQMQGNPDYDRMRTAVGDWLTDAEVELDLDVTRGMLAALSLVHTRLEAYVGDDMHAVMDMLLAEVGATLIDLFENPRIDMKEFE